MFARDETDSKDFGVNTPFHDEYSRHHLQEYTFKRVLFKDSRIFYTNLLSYLCFHAFFHAPNIVVNVLCIFKSVYVSLYGAVFGILSA